MAPGGRLLELDFEGEVADALSVCGVDPSGDDARLVSQLRAMHAKAVHEVWRTATARGADVRDFASINE